MPELSESHYDATRDEVRDARRKRAKIVRASFPFPATKLDSRQSTQRVLGALLTRQGVDRSELEILATQRKTEADELAARHLAESEQHLSALLETANRDIGNWRNSINQLAIFVPPPVQRFLLNTASDVSATSGVPLSSSNLAPGNNWVQFLFLTLHETPEFDVGLEEVSFSFFWQNLSNRTVTINVDAYLILTGMLQLVAFGGDVLSGFCYMAVHGELHIHELWNQPPTSPLFQSGQSQLAAPDFSVSGGGLFQDPESQLESVFRGFDLQYTQLVVPPNGVAMFDVACSIEYKNRLGSVRAIFVDRGRQMQSPGVLITVLG